jgi:hypothetical protein
MKYLYILLGWKRRRRQAGRQAGSQLASQPASPHGARAHPHDDDDECWYLFKVVKA